MSVATTVRRMLQRALQWSLPGWFAGPRIVQAGFGGSSAAGEPVTESTAIACAAVWSCVRVIADAVASLPLHVYRRAPDGGRERLRDHWLAPLLSWRSTPEMSAMRFRHLMQSWLLLWGNAYARLAKRGNRIVAMWPVHPARVSVQVARDGSITYSVDNEETQPGTLLHLRGPSLDGMTGMSVISAARHAIGLALIQERYMSEFYAAGGRRPYYLRKLTRFASDQDFERFRAAWQDAYGSSRGFHRAPILEGDLELHELGMSMQDAQYLASRQFSVLEICRWFLVPPHMVGELGRATWGNIEHQAIEFVSRTLGYWLGVWEAEIAAQLLGYGDIYVEHETRGLLRGDYGSRTRGYATLLQNGVLSVNEVRAFENLNSIAGGDEHHIQVNMQPLGAAAGGGDNASDTSA